MMIDNRLTDWYTLNRPISEEFKAMLEERKSTIQRQLALVKNKDPTQTFIGPCSYDIRLHPDYKQLFKWEEELKILLTGNTNEFSSQTSGK